MKRRVLPIILALALCLHTMQLPVMANGQALLVTAEEEQRPDERKEEASGADVLEAEETASGMAKKPGSEEPEPEISNLEETVTGASEKPESEEPEPEVSDPEETVPGESEEPKEPGSEEPEPEVPNPDKTVTGVPGNEAAGNTAETVTPAPEGVIPEEKEVLSGTLETREQLQVMTAGTGEQELTPGRTKEQTENRVVRVAIEEGTWYYDYNESQEEEGVYGTPVEALQAAWSDAIEASLDGTAVQIEILQSVDLGDDCLRMDSGNVILTTADEVSLSGCGTANEAGSVRAVISMTGGSLAVEQGTLQLSGISNHGIYVAKGSVSIRDGGALKMKSSNSDYYALYLQTGSIFSMNQGEVQCTGNAGAISVSGSKITLENGSWISSEQSAGILARNVAGAANPEITITDSEIESRSACLVTGNRAQVQVSGSTFTSAASMGIEVYNYANLTISDSEITGSTYGVRLSSDNDVTITGQSSITATRDTGIGIYVMGRCTIKGDQVTVTGVSSGITLSGQGSRLDLEGGVVIATGAESSGIRLAGYGNNQLNVTGGKVTGVSYGLNVSNSSLIVVSLAGGTFSATEEDGYSVYNGKTDGTAADLLAGNYVYLCGETNKQPVPLLVYPELKGLSVTDGYGTVTVGTCTHLYSDEYQELESIWRDDGGDTHSTFCLACGGANEIEEHDFGENGVCDKCQANARARVTTGETVQYYGAVTSAWSAAIEKSLEAVSVPARVEILQSVDLGEDCLRMDAGNVILTTAEGVTLSGYGLASESDIRRAVIVVTGGSLTVEQGTLLLKVSSRYTNHGIYVSGGTVSIQNGGVIEMSSTESSRFVLYMQPGSSLLMDKGTIRCREYASAVSAYSSRITLENKSLIDSEYGGISAGEMSGGEASEVVIKDSVNKSHNGCFSVMNNTKATIENSTLTSAVGTGLVVYSYGECTVTDSRITGSSSGIAESTYSKVTITGKSEITATGSNGVGIRSIGVTTIQGNQVKVAGVSSGITVGTQNSHLILEGGSVTATGSESSGISLDNIYGSATIKGGRISGVSYGLYAKGYKNISITGGTFSAAEESGYSVYNGQTEAAADLLASGYGFYQVKEDGTKGQRINATGQSMFSKTVYGDVMAAAADPEKEPEPELFSVTVVWEDLSFTYTDSVWNTDTYTYENGGWRPDEEGGGVVKVQNNGVGTVTATAVYEPESDNAVASVSGTFDRNSVAVSGGAEESFLLTLKGKPEGTLENTHLGTITITITGGDSGG